MSRFESSYLSDDCNGARMITIYTDGSALGNPGPGGRGAIVLEWSDQPVELSGYETDSTNNRMELQAVISGLRWLLEQEDVTFELPDPSADAGVGLFADPAVVSELSHKGSKENFVQPVQIFTDSTYVQKGVTERVETRIRRDRRRSKGGQLVKNAELWQQLHALTGYFASLERSWVKAHVGNKRNEKVDDLARAAAIKGDKS